MIHNINRRHEGCPRQCGSGWFRTKESTVDGNGKFRPHMPHMPSVAGNRSSSVCDNVCAVPYYSSTSTFGAVQWYFGHLYGSLHLPFLRGRKNATCCYRLLTVVESLISVPCSVLCSFYVVLRCGLGDSGGEFRIDPSRWLVV